MAHSACSERLRRRYSSADSWPGRLGRTRPGQNKQQYTVLTARASARAHYGLLARTLGGGGGAGLVVHLGLLHPVLRPVPVSDLPPAVLSNPVTKQNKRPGGNPGLLKTPVLVSSPGLGSSHPGEDHLGLVQGPLGLQDLGLEGPGGGTPGLGLGSRPGAPPVLLPGAGTAGSLAAAGGARSAGLGGLGPDGLGSLGASTSLGVASSAGPVPTVIIREDAVPGLVVPGHPRVPPPPPVSPPPLPGQLQPLVPGEPEEYPEAGGLGHLGPGATAHGNRLGLQNEMIRSNQGTQERKHFTYRD